MIFQFFTKNLFKFIIIIINNFNLEKNLNNLKNLKNSNILKNYKNHTKKQ